MPIYEYQCYSCGQSFEYLVFAGGEGPNRCRICDGTKVSRIMSVCASITKGSGGAIDHVESSSASSPSCGACAASSCAGCK